MATGTVKEERKHLLNYDRPNYKIYPVQRNGRYLEAFECAFCGQPSSEEELRTKVGPVYGPLKLKKRGEKYYVHELCAIWTPEIYLDALNHFKDLK